MSGVFSALRKLCCERWTRLAGAALVAGFAAMLLALWHPVYRFTGLLQIDAGNEARALPVLREQPVAFNDGGYDGQYYVQIACDPSLRNRQLPAAIDSLPYRARRVLLPAAAWVLGLGRPEQIVQVFPWLNIACWLALAALLWLLLQADNGWRCLAAWTGVLFSAGVLASVRYSLTDLPALLLFVLAMRAAEAGRPRTATAWFAGALLSRETALVGAWGLWPKAWDRPRSLVRMAGWVVLAVVPLAAWLLYLRWQVGPAAGGLRNFSWPLVGFIGRGEEAWRALRTEPNALLAWASLLATAATAMQLVFLFRYLSAGDRWWRAGAGVAALALCLGAAVWEGFPGAAPRVLLPLLLACNVIAIRHRRAAVWLLLLNLSVPAGLMEMIPMPDARELAAARQADAAVVLRLADGCFGKEAAGTSRWCWTDQQAAFELRQWTGGEPTEVVLTVGLRAVQPRELVITARGIELWRGMVGVQTRRVALKPIALQDGTLSLQLQADAPGVCEPTGTDRRALSVCVENPGLVIGPR